MEDDRDSGGASLGAADCFRLARILAARAARAFLELIFSGFGLRQPSPAKFFRRNARKIRLEVEDRRSVKHIHTANAQARAVATEKFEDGQSYRSRPAWRTGGEDSVLTSVVGRWRGDKVKIHRTVECPDHEKMRKAFNIGEAGGELWQDFEHAFVFMLCAEAFGNV